MPTVYRTAGLPAGLVQQNASVRAIKSSDSHSTWWHFGNIRVDWKWLRWRFQVHLYRPKDKGSTGQGIFKDGVSVVPSAVQNHQTSYQHALTVIIIYIFYSIFSPSTSPHWGSGWMLAGPRADNGHCCDYSGESIHQFTTARECSPS